MRRSAALKIITDIVSEVTYENLAEKRAEKILDALEEAGVSPPKILIPGRGDSMDCAGNIIEYDDFYDNEWEPEE